MKNLKRNKFIILLLILIPLAVLIIIFFVTRPRLFASHSQVDLLTTNAFAILAGSAITDTGTSVITGDVGLDPTTGAAITGLTCAEVTGTIYDNDGGYAGGGGGSTACRVTNASLLTTAKNDLTTAYNDAAGRTTTSQIGTELGGTTLTDGTYDSASGTFGLTGTLTLDGQGNPNAVFIFKMATTLITASSSRVVLINGAQACNVFWQVGSSATLGTGTVLVGNVLALTSISDDGASTVNGRLLARNGAVTLINTTITKSTCAASPTSTPTPTPTLSPTPTSTPTATPTTSPTSTSSSSSSGTTSTSSTSSGPTLNNIVAPTIIESKRVDSDSIFISWGPYSGIDTFIIQYGPENGEWLYNTNVTGFSTTLNDLPLHQPIWVRVGVRNNGSIGNYGEAKFVGEPLRQK